MHSRVKITFILICWLLLSGYVGAGIQVAGCVATHVVPPVAEAVDSAVKKGLGEIGRISDGTQVVEKKNDWTDPRRGTSPSSSASNTENKENSIITDYASMSPKLICIQAIRYSDPRWEEDDNPYVIEAKKRNLSEEQCIPLTGRFKTYPTAAIFANKPCTGTYKPSWNDCIGTRTFPDKALYKGPWKFGKAHGKGTLTYTNGEKYVGSFKDGMHHGEGTITYPSGKAMKGIWDNDKFKSERK